MYFVLLGSYIILFSTLRKHIHLTFVAGKLEAELPAVAQTKEERFLPRGLAPSPLHTIAQRITQTVAALHQQHLLLPLCPVAQLESIAGLRHAVCLIERAAL